jgi:hypothetical protein
MLHYPHIPRLDLLKSRRRCMIQNMQKDDRQDPFLYVHFVLTNYMAHSPYADVEISFSSVKKSSNICAYLSGTAEDSSLGYYAVSTAK